MSLETRIEDYHWIFGDEEKQAIPDIYSLYVVIGKIFRNKRFESSKDLHYLSSTYNMGIDSWYITSTKYLIPTVKSMATNKCKDIHNDYHTQFSFRIETNPNRKNSLINTIQTLSNQYPVIKPSIDNHTRLWYPKDLLLFIKGIDDEQYAKFMRYITRGE